MNNLVTEPIVNMPENFLLGEGGSFESSFRPPFPHPDTSFMNIGLLNEGFSEEEGSTRFNPPPYFEMNEEANTGGRNIPRFVTTITRTPPPTTTPSLINHTFTAEVNSTVTPTNKIGKFISDTADETTENMIQNFVIQSTTHSQLNDINHTEVIGNSTFKSDTAGSSLTTSQVIALATVIPAVIILFVVGLLLWRFIFSDKRHANTRVGFQEEESPANEEDDVPRSQSSLSKTLHSAALRENDSRNGERPRQLAWVNNESRAVEQT